MNLEIAPGTKVKLDRLMEQSEADSMTEVVRRALAVYDLILGHHLSEGEIILRSGDGTEKRLALY